ncbi:hypothetical protein Vadar_024471 [Vaccinium darrowii]|uniref:Uncharacterized protein n=1 Tax=Vaccinium darrowii TaxID=229202 RepID=A0ACB7Z613_9ERIC|nr:hypothetical protein Vadar_024471 [Vaccinium darrowii]
MMSPSTTHSSEARPQLDESPNVEVEVNNESEDGWWKKVVDLEEIKKQVLYSLPMIITNVSYYLIPVVSVLFAGHLGDLELAGSNLANSWATVTGYAFMTHSFVVPLLVCSLLPLIAHIGIAYVLVHSTPLGFEGAALAVSISLWIAVLMLAGYTLISKKLKRTWNGFLVVESLNHVFTTLRLALPSAAMVCLEYWAFQLLILLAGLMPLSRITTPSIAMCVNTGAIAYMVTYGLSAAASTRVSNELGAGNPDRAKHAVGVTLMLSLFLALANVLALAFGHNIWAGFFSDNSTIIKKFASLSHFLMISIILDSIQGVLSGVARGCGWQHLAVYINLGTLYCIGLPISIFLGFKRKLYAEGLWLGLICGLSCQDISLLLLIQCSKWTRMELSDSSKKESHALPNNALNNDESHV